MVDTSRLNDAGGPTGRAPWWSWVVAAAVVAAIVVVAVLVIRDARAARAEVSPWTYLGGPATSVGGTYIWTRCDGSRRLYQTTGADGFPAGPPTVVTFAAGSGCPRGGGNS